MAQSAIQVFLEMLAEFGVRYIFGNPGSTELPLNDALVEDRRFQYILGLQEVPVMSVADGFAMAAEEITGAGPGWTTPNVRARRVVVPSGGAAPLTGMMISFKSSWDSMAKGTIPSLV